MQFLVSGSLAYDRIMTFPGKFSDHILPDKIHILNVCFLIDRLEENFGGTAGNIAYTLSLLGEESLILATAGKDFDRYESWLREHSISMKGIRLLDNDFTAGAYITTDQSDNQITGFNPGAMRQPCDFDVNTLPPTDSLAILGPGNKDDMIGLPAKYRELKVPYIFDPGQQIPAFSGDELLSCIDGAYMLVTNDYELEMIMKATGLTKAQLAEKCQVILTTLGEQGSLIHANGEETKVGAVKLDKATDPTGAGDAFRAGLLKGHAMGKSLEECAKMGAVSASFCVEQYGTQVHRFTMDEFTARFEATFGPMG